MWVEKYRPTKLSEMVGNEDVRVTVGAWLKKWKPGSKPVLLVGPPGTGKTTLVMLLAKETGTNIVELNASDTRTKGKLEKKLGEAIRTVSLFGERSLIFLDEVDGLLGRSDYGGLEFIRDAIKETLNPIIMAANDPDSDEIRKLEKTCLTLRFKPPPPREIELYLRMVAEREGVKVADDVLRGYVVSSGGDIRHAINSMQSRRVDPAAGYKDASLSVSQGLNSFFEAPDEGAALEAMKKVPLDARAKVRELNQCLVASRLPAERRSAALRAVSSADVLVGRIGRTQEWRLLRYLDAILARDLFASVKNEGVKHSPESLPFPTLLRLWNDSKKVSEISRRYSSRTHTSARSSRSRDLPYLFSLCSSKRFRAELERSLDLDEAFDKFLEREARR